MAKVIDLHRTTLPSSQLYEQLDLHKRACHVCLWQTLDHNNASVLCLLYLLYLRWNSRLRFLFCFAFSSCLFHLKKLNKKTKTLTDKWINRRDRNNGGQTHKTITDISTHSVAQISILETLNAAIRVALLNIQRLHWWNFLQLEAWHSVWTLEGVKAHISPLHLIRKALCWCKGGVEGKGKGVGVGLGGVKAEAGDSRLLACVVFPLRDLYTDVVGINFWWTISTAYFPLALSSHLDSSHSLPPSLPSSLSVTGFSPTYVNLLSYILHIFALEHLSRLLEPLYLCHSSWEGLRDLGWTSLL